MFNCQLTLALISCTPHCFPPPPPHLMSGLSQVKTTFNCQLTLALVCPPTTTTLSSAPSTSSSPAGAPLPPHPPPPTVHVLVSRPLDAYSGNATLLRSKNDYVRSVSGFVSLRAENATVTDLNDVTVTNWRSDATVTAQLFCNGLLQVAPVSLNLSLPTYIRDERNGGGRAEACSHGGGGVEGKGGGGGGFWLE
jgi:hypothetical protein